MLGRPKLIAAIGLSVLGVGLLAYFGWSRFFAQTPSQRAYSEIAPIVERQIVPLIVSVPPQIDWEIPEPGKLVSANTPDLFYVKGTLRDHGGWITITGTMGNNLYVKFLYCAKSSLEVYPNMSVEAAAERIKPWLTEAGIRSEIVNGLHGTRTRGYQWTSEGHSSQLGGTIIILPYTNGVEFVLQLLYDPDTRKIG
jgi:hypothetical protein